MSPEQLAILWQAVCKAHDNARKHQWKEPYRTRWEEAQSAFDQAQIEFDKEKPNA